MITSGVIDSESYVKIPTCQGGYHLWWFTTNTYAGPFELPTNSLCRPFVTAE